MVLLLELMVNKEDYGYVNVIVETNVEFSINILILEILLLADA